MSTAPPVDAVTLEVRAAASFGRVLGAGSRAAARNVALACLDVTTLEGADTPHSVRAVCARVRAATAGEYAPAAVCVFASMVGVARDALHGTRVAVASVAGAFPSGQASIDVKLAETRAAIAAGASEIDVVLDRGAFLAGRYDVAFAQLAAIREACAGVTLKVIVEAGELGSYSAIRHACSIALEAGADFVKTATGKIAVSTTPPIALALCDAVRAHRRRTGRIAGVKFAGGIRNAAAAFGYVSLVKEALGDEWLRPATFRLGASRLLDDLVRVA
jgi:deoxyribose-phosphate aldolase